MRREAVAEWILGQVMSRDRSAAVVGDLSESNAGQGGFRFWTSIAGIVLASTWMWGIALAAGIYLAAWSVVSLNGVLFGQALRFFWTPYHIPPVWNQFLDGLARLSTILLMLAPYLVARYGIKDKLTRVLLGSLVLILGTTCLWWLPAALPICIAAGVSGIVACLWTSERRRALGITVGTGATGLLSAPVAAWLISLVHHPAFGCELQGCIAQTTPAIEASQVLLAAPLVLVCTLMHQRLMESKRSEESRGLQVS